VATRHEGSTDDFGRRGAEADVLAYLDFPVDHWRSISSTNAIERVNAELDRRAKVVGIFPKTADGCAYE
jgi:transposase-like protein